MSKEISQKTKEESKLKRFWSNNRGIIIFLASMLFFRSTIADWYHVPTGSMQPNILIGDRVWVNKLAYDVKIPFTDINLNRHSEPVAGDVVVFDSTASDERLIKRVIGVPGDRIAMQDNQLFINGVPLKLEFLAPEQSFDTFLKDRNDAAYFNETLDAKSDKAYPIRVRRLNFNPRSSFSEILVPEDSLWVMGDNRDNSQDSRWIGVVPRSELIGRAERVILSLNSDNYYLPRSDRYLEKL